MVKAKVPKYTANQEKKRKPGIKCVICGQESDYSFCPAHKSRESKRVG